MLRTETFVLCTFLGIIALIPSLGLSYAFLDQICFLANANSTMIRNCIDSYLQFEKMSKTSYNSMQANLDQQRNDIRENQVLQNATIAGDYKSVEPQVAKAMINGDLLQREWYNERMQYNLEKMMQQVKYWKTYDHNPEPQPACPAWHECGPNGVPLNYTQIEQEIKSQNQTMSHYQQNSTVPAKYLKPEMSQYPTGIVNQVAAVKNWQDLEKWFMEKQNQTSTH